MQDTQIYSFFLIKGNSTEGAVFLFKKKIVINFRPVVGDSLSSPITNENFRVMRDEIDPGAELQIRVTDQGDERITDDGSLRITQIAEDLDGVTHKYFVTPANNPNRISSYTTSRFANDQTLRQLFR